VSRLLLMCVSSEGGQLTDSSSRSIQSVCGCVQMTWQPWRHPAAWCLFRITPTAVMRSHCRRPSSWKGSAAPPRLPLPTKLQPG
jgi:hypothetical protein